jgi:hypothetical protein
MIRARISSSAHERSYRISINGHRIREKLANLDLNLDQGSHPVDLQPFIAVTYLRWLYVAVT